MSVESTGRTLSPGISPGGGWGLGDCFARLLPRSPEDSEQGLEGSSRLSEPCSLGRPHAEHLGTEFMAPLSF